MKFKDADLIGIPIRIAVGRRGLAEGKVEWKRRGTKDVELVPLGEVVRRAETTVRDAELSVSSAGAAWQEIELEL